VGDSEAELFLDVREERPGAWNRLVERYAALVHSVPRQMGLSSADSEEVSQVTWMTVHRHLFLIEKPRSLAHWLITTASREAWKLRQARHRREQIESGGARAEVSDQGSDPAEILERLEEVELIRAALDELPERCAELLRALYLGEGERSYRDVGQELGMPQGSIGPTRMRCLAHLAQILEPRLRS